MCSICQWQDDVIKREAPIYGDGSNHGISIVIQEKIT
ncbi:CPCC family cysteine-rich protein [Enterococcus gilvus]